MGAFAATFLSSQRHKRAVEPGGRGRDGHGNPDGGPLCLLRGTGIKTPKGEVCVEDIRIGDLVETVRGEALPIKWIGRHLYHRSGPTWSEAVVPIRIAPSALDENSPSQELYVTRGHALFIDGVLIRAGDLVNGTSIVPALPTRTDRIEYFQIVLATHEVILAENAPVETFLLKDSNYEGFTNFAEFARLYPAERGATMAPFAPFVGYGGKEHLKVLLRLTARRYIRVRSPLLNVHQRTAVRGNKFAG